MKDLPIELLNTQTEVASGQHMPADNAWSMPDINLAIDDEDEDIVKEALGLLDIPASIDGGEVLNFQGSPENPGLSREGEEVDFFGAEAEPDDLPPKNNLKISKSIIKYIKSINTTFLKSNQEVFKFMDKELKDLELKLKKAGKQAELDLIFKIKKEAGGTGALVGSGLGLLAGLLPGVSVVPASIRMVMGGAAGHLIQEYIFNNPKFKTALEQQAATLSEIQQKLTAYGVTHDELLKLSNHELTPETLIEHMVKRGARMPAGWKEPIKTLALQYVTIADKMVEVFKQAQAATTPAQSQVEAPQERVVTQPEARTEPQVTQNKGSITRPGDPYTYGKNPNGEGYIVVSAPPGKEGVVGRVLAPGTEAYELVKAADPEAGELNQPETAKTQARKMFQEAQDATLNNEHAKAAELYQKSYDLLPTGNALFNAGKAYYESGDGSKALDIFKKYKEQYPEDWTKNLKLIPQMIRDKLEPLSASRLEEGLIPTPEKIQAVLERLLQGGVVKVQTQEGMGTALDSDRVRKLTRRYVEAIAKSQNKDGFKSIEESLPLVAHRISAEFGKAIEERLQTHLDQGEDARQLEGVLNGAVWQALRKGWAQWQHAAFREQPTPHSQERRTNKINRQDEHWSEKAERELRREKAKREARRLLVESFHKEAMK